MSPVDKEASGSPDPQFEWVVQDLGNGRRLGKVVEQQDNLLRVAFGSEVFAWTSVPRSARLIETDSLIHRSLSDPSRVIAELKEKPEDAVIELIKSAPNGLLASDIKGELVGLDLLEKADVDALWKRVQPKLKRNPNLRTQGKPARYFYDPASHPQEEPKEELRASYLLERVGKLRKTSSKYLDYTAKLHDLRQTDALNVEEIAWGTEVGVFEGEAPPSFDELDPDKLPAAGQKALLERASKTGASHFVVRLAMAPRDTEASREALWIATNSLSPGDVSPVIAKVFSDWGEQLQQSDDDAVAAAAEAALRRTRSIDRLVLSRITPELCASFLYLHSVSVSAGSSRTEVGALGDWAFDRAEQAALRPDDLAKSVALLPEDWKQKSLLCLRGKPMHRGGLRRELLRSIAQVGSSRALHDPRLWQDLTLASLIDLSHDLFIGPLLFTDPLLSSVVRTAVDRAIDREELSALLRLSSLREEQLAPLITDRLRARLWEMVQHSPHASGLGLTQEHERLIELEVAHERDQQALRELKAALATAQHEIEELNSRLTGSMRDTRGASSKEVRRAKIRALRVLADVAEEMRELSRRGVPHVGDTLANAISRARSEGLEIRDEAGEMTEFDPDWHEPLGEEPTVGTLVLVVESSYQVVDRDGSTIVRHAKVRKPQT